MDYHSRYGKDPEPKHGWIFLAILFVLAIYGLFVFADAVTMPPLMYVEGE